MCVISFTVVVALTNHTNLEQQVRALLCVFGFRVFGYSLLVQAICVLFGAYEYQIHAVRHDQFLTDLTVC